MIFLIYQTFVFITCWFKRNYDL